MIVLNIYTLLYFILTQDLVDAVRAGPKKTKSDDAHLSMVDNIKVIQRENSCQMTDPKTSEYFTVRRIAEGNDTETYISWHQNKAGVRFRTTPTLQWLRFTFDGHSTTVCGAPDKVNKYFEYAHHYMGVGDRLPKRSRNLNPFRDVADAVREVLERPGRPDCNEILLILTTSPQGETRPFNWVSTFFFTNRHTIKDRLQELKEVPNMYNADFSFPKLGIFHLKSDE